MFSDPRYLIKDPIDYSALGFKCGLEIHRRLKGTKLFCKCNGNINELEDAKELQRFRRVLNISKSEEHTIDAAAWEEVKKGRYYEYVFYDKGCCLIECDEAPPLEPSNDALEKAIKTTMLLNCHLLNEILFMRKIVVDGSNTTGFQRTAIIGMDGYVETSKGKVGISTVCLEEESAQIVEVHSDHVVYDLRRLGIPLIEIATAPDLKDAEHVREVAQYIGDLLRYSGFYQRGIGSIRQDINISISQGCRVEIKGVQDLDLIVDVVKKEVQRQRSLVILRDTLKTMKVSFSNVVDVSEYFSKVENRLFKGKKVHGFSIKNMKGLFSLYITDTKRLGKELASYVKVKTPAKGFIHSDEDLSKYSIENEMKQIKKEVFKEDDLVILVIGSKDLAERVKEVLKWYFDTLLSQGLLNETRKALGSGDTDYLRPLPGSSRMYPETDVRPVHVSDEWVKHLRKSLPPTKEELYNELSKLLGNEELVKQFMDSKYFELYLDNKAFFNKEKVAILLNVVRDIERKYSIDVMLNPKYLFSAVDMLVRGAISKDAFIEVIKKAYMNDLDPEDIVRKENLFKISKDEILRELEHLENKEFGYVVSYMKKKYGVRVDIKDVSEILRGRKS